MNNEDRINSVLNEIIQPVVAIASDYPAGHTTQWHSHDRAQLVYAVQGVLTVSTHEVAWVAPPQRAVWVPARQPHHVEASKNAAMRSLFVTPELGAGLPEKCTVVQVTALMRELLLAFIEFPQPYDEQGQEGRLVQVMIDQLVCLPAEPLQLPASDESRINKILAVWYQTPADQRDLKQWASNLNTSVRTISRLFSSELGMSFTKCRQQIHLLAAIKLLAEGRSVASVALDVGFQSQSSFTSLFRRVYGVTPKQYFAD